MTEQAAVKAVVEAGTDALLTDSVAVFLRSSDGARFDLVGQGGLRPDMASTWASFAADAPVPVADAVRRRELVRIDGIEDRERRYPALGTGPIRSETIVVAPLRIHDGLVLGAVSLGFDDRRSLDETDLAFVTAAADICAQAIHHARLLEYRDRTVLRQRSLASASQLLAEDLDHHHTLHRVARLVVGDVADVCAVCLRDGAALRTAVAVHADADGQAVLDQLVARQPVITSERLLEVMRTGEAVFAPQTDVAEQGAAIEDPAHLALIRELGTTSGIVVPMQARGETLGLLLLLRVGDAPAFTDEDRGFSEDLASRAALAIDNARLFTERAELIDNLQHALSSHTAIEQAKGVLAVRWGVEPSEAFERMRRHARSARRSIAELADEVVAGTDDLGG